jgi:hypothetical protein
MIGRSWEEEEIHRRSRREPSHSAFLADPARLRETEATAPARPPGPDRIDDPCCRKDENF